MILKYENRILQKRVGNEVRKSIPTVSIIIPSYNVAKFIATTLNTVFAQTYQNFEVIVVNDGSPDITELEQSLVPFFEKIIYIKQKNGGAAAARNMGIGYARGKFLAFLDGDDLWFSEYLQSQMDFLKQNNFQMVYCNALIFNENDSGSKTYMDSAPSAGKVTAESLILAECNVITSGTIVEKDIVIRLQGFDENPAIAGFEDFNLWVGLAKQGCRIGFQKKVLVKYRETITGLSGGNIKRAERVVNALNYIYERNDLTENEKRALKHQLNISQAELKLEIGKSYLVRKDFGQSIYHLSEANSFYLNKKLKWTIRFLKLTPNLVFGIYKIFCADEFNFIKSSNLIEGK